MRGFVQGFFGRGMGISTVLFMLAVLACDARAETSSPVEDGLLRSAQKIDPALRDALESTTPVPVVILLADQVALGPDALEVIAERFAGQPRSAVRAEVIAELRQKAEGQAALSAELGLGPDIPRLWIANALFPSLTGEQIRAAAERPEVRYIYRGDGTFPPDEPGPGPAAVVPSTDGLFEVGSRRVPWNLERIGARAVWEELGITGEGVVVQVMDVGTEYRHPDLAGRLWVNPDEIAGNGIDDDGNGAVDDLYGYDFGQNGGEVYPAGTGAHGTFTAGIVAGDGTGGIITGVAPRARLQITRGGGLYGVGRALEYALIEGADIVTMSFSIPNLGASRGFWRLMADQATAAGVVLVSGAGNFRQTESVPVQQRIPEGIPSVISVGGVDQTLVPARFSSMGPVDWHDVPLYEDHPSLVKPDVTGFPGPGYPVLQPGGGYVDPNQQYAGNSFSGPHAAGVAALVLSANPELNGWEVKEILEATAEDLLEPGKDNETGWGLLDARAAVEEALRRRGG